MSNRFVKEILWFLVDCPKYSQKFKDVENLRRLFVKDKNMPTEEPVDDFDDEDDEFDDDI